MRVAEIQMTLRSFGTANTICRIGFSDVARAKTEYQRVADLIAKQEDSHNDKPSTITIIGDGEEHTVALRDIGSVGLCDWAAANEEMKGVKDAFPYLFVK